MMNDYLIVLDHQERLDDARRKRELSRLLSIGRAERYSPVGTFLSTVAVSADRLAEKGLQAVRQALRGGSQPSEECC